MAYKFGRENKQDLMDRGKNRYGSPRMNAGQDFLPAYIVGTGFIKGKVIRHNNLEYRVEELDENPIGVPGYWVTPTDIEDTKAGKHNGKKDDDDEEENCGCSNAKMVCLECDRTFSKANPTSDTKCPGCGGYDIEVADNSKENASAYEKALLELINGAGDDEDYAEVAKKFNKTPKEVGRDVSKMESEMDTEG